MDIGEMQRRLSHKAERDPDHRFGDLFALICHREWLQVAHDTVARNAGSKTAGCDGIKMSDFDMNLEERLQELRDSLRNGTFQPHPVRRVYIPKANGKVRPLGIPSVRDRIVQEAVRMALEPIYEADFLQSSYGFRPNRCTTDAIHHAYGYMREQAKFFWVIEGDISSYFDAINHMKLVKLLRRRIEDKELLDLIWRFLRSGVMEHKLFKDTKLGTPQGGIASPLLANVYLHELDKFMEQYTNLPVNVKKRRRRTEGLANFAYVRYADDFIVLSNGTKEQAVAFRDELREFLSNELRLTLSMEKTNVTHLNDGFDFLGFRCQRSQGGKGGMTTRITIPKKAIDKHMDAMKRAFSISTPGDSVALKFMAVSKVIEGWCRYYQYTAKASTQFNRIWHEVYWLVANWLACKYRCRTKQAIIRFRQGPTLGMDLARLTPHTQFHTKRYALRTRPFPNPYTSGALLKREELPERQPHLGHETRKGMMDLRVEIMTRDGFRCQWPECGREVTLETGQVDHIRPRHCFGWKPDADKPSNLWTLCPEHHRIKTENDRQRESRVR